MRRNTWRPGTRHATLTQSPYQADGFASAVGVATHRVLAEVVAGRGKHTPEELIDSAWLLAATAVDQPAIGRRARAARLMVSGHAAVYVRRFLPPPGWSCLGTELDIGDDLRVDLAFGSRRGVFFDELKLADGRTVPRGEGPTARQVTAYAQRGATLHGPRFLGVRLLFLGAPNQSLLIHPDGQREALADAGLALPDHPDAAPLAVVRQAAGGAA